MLKGVNYYRSGTSLKIQKVDAYLTAPNVGDSLSVDTLIIDYNWQPSPAADDSGIVTFRGIPYQIVYDPPGDGSSSSFAKDSSFTTSVTTSFGASAGATIGFGYSYENPLANSGIDAEVSASVNYKHNKDDNFTATVTRNSTLSTPGSQLDTSLLGPGRGDIFVCPSMKLRWHLYRAYAPHDKDAYSADGYVYKIFYRLVSDSNSSLLTVPVSQLSNYVTDSAALRQILAASAIDPNTHRIRSSLVDGNGNPRTNRLVRISGSTDEVVGGTTKTETSGKSQTQTVTITQSLDIGVTASLKVKAFGGSESFSLSVGVSLGGSTSGSTTTARTMSYTFHDENPWDYFKFNTYLDQAYGVYVFDVDSSLSWSSLPFESDYSSPSERFGVVADHDTLVVAPGDVDTFRLTTSNASRTGYPSLDTIRAVSANVLVNSGADVSAPAGIWNVVRGTPTLYKVAVGAPKAGVYPVEIALSGTVGGTTYTQVKHLTLVVGDGGTGIRALRTNAPTLSGDARSIRVRCASAATWTLRVRDLSGRVVLETTGQGNRTLPLPQGVNSLTIQELSVAGAPMIRRVGVAVQ